MYTVECPPHSEDVFSFSCVCVYCVLSRGEESSPDRMTDSRANMGKVLRRNNKLAFTISSHTHTHTHTQSSTVSEQEGGGGEICNVFDHYSICITGSKSYRYQTDARGIIMMLEVLYQPA